MLDRNGSIEMIVDAVQAQIDLDGSEVAGPVDEATILLGEDAPIDSLGLVNVIIEVEQGVLDGYGASIIVVDERAMSMTNSPFRTVGTLADYVIELVTETA